MVLVTVQNAADSDALREIGLMENTVAGQFLVFFIICALTVSVLANSTLRGAFEHMGAPIGAVFERGSAFVVRWVFDPTFPIDELSNKAPRARVLIWMIVSLIIVVAWALVDRADAPATVKLAVLGVNVTLGILNLIFLVGAYCALREGLAIMNFDRKFGPRNFGRRGKDPMVNFPTTARNAMMVSAAALLASLQLAVVVDWLNDVTGGAVLRISGAVGLAYANAFLATAGSIPFVSLSLTASGLSSQASFAPGMGFWVGQIINAIASALLVGTVLGFAQERTALKRLIGNLLAEVNTQDSPTFQRLWDRLNMAPSTVKREIRRAFDEEVDDNKRILLVRAALYKKSYRFPATFVARFGHMSPAVKKEGARLVTAHLDSMGQRYSKEVLLAVIKAMGRSFRHLSAPGDKEQVGGIVLRCVDRLAALDAVEYKRTLALPSVQGVLAALLDGNSGADIQQRALDAMLVTRSQRVWLRLLPAFPSLPEALQRRALERLNALVTDPSVTLSPEIATKIERWLQNKRIIPRNHPCEPLARAIVSTIRRRRGGRPPTSG